MRKRCKDTTIFSILQYAFYWMLTLDDEEKLPNENPSIGIILCKDANKAYVEYVLQDYNKPMGVATYKTRREQLQELLPDETKLKELL